MPEKSSLIREIDHARQAIAAAPLRDFAVPHIIVDNIFPEDFLARINDTWPTRETFQPEVPGNYIFQMYRKDYGRIAEPQRQFWQNFNEVLWPNVISAVAQAFSAPAAEVFGDLYYEHLSLDWPLTLMQADPTYTGHDMHTHFYHCPHWAFTTLLYIDPEDTCSRGTALNRAQPPEHPNADSRSYQSTELDWRVDVAMRNIAWDGPSRPDAAYRPWVSDYRANRLFVFLDGPLALHSVPFDNPERTPNPARALNGGRHSRRRILRSHVKVHHSPFYAKHSALLPKPLDPERYMRVMAPNPALSADDQRYRDNVIQPFYRERLEAYARAAEAARGQKSTVSRGRKLWERLTGRGVHVDDNLTARLIKRLP